MPVDMLNSLNLPNDNVYDEPDVFNPFLHPPAGDIDVLNIVESGTHFKPLMAPSLASFYRGPSHKEKSKQIPGKGVTLMTYSGDNFCDGTLDSFCNRGISNNCLLEGHNDGRNGIRFDSTNGWVTMKLPNLQYGYIVVKLETWHRHGDAIPGWRGNFDNRNQLCPSFHFEYAIDGNITSLGLADFYARKQSLQWWYVEVLTLLEDPNYAKAMGGPIRDVDVAIRITGCANENVMSLTHIYWA